MDGDILVRDVNDIDLVEVSILDRTRSPVYKGNTIELSTRSENGDAVFFSEPLFYEEEVKEEKEKIDYSHCENLIKDMKGEK